MLLTYFNGTTRKPSSKAFQIRRESVFSGFIALLMPYFQFWGPYLAVDLLHSICIIRDLLKTLYRPSLIAIRLSFILIYIFMYIISLLLYLNERLITDIKAKLLYLFLNHFS